MLKKNVKKELGQYFTIENPFKFKLFKEWCKNVKTDDILLEPFAGSNNIIKLIEEININNKWKCYDIDTDKPNNIPKYEVTYNDSINNFPQGYNVCITNPPYLAKVSASRLKLKYPETEYADLYMLCLEKMLDNCKYVAAIIPESFVTQDLFVNRLFGVISLNIKMFDDTDCPVCLALFVPENENMNCPVVYVGDDYIGDLCKLSEYNLSEYYKKYTKWKFNDKEGILGIKCVDNNKENDIKFFYGEKIKPEDIKISSRAFSRISGVPEDVDLDTFINECNLVIEEYRKNTGDVFLTSFKGLRTDGKYRRRIDFKTVKCIMNKALYNLNYFNDNSFKNMLSVLHDIKNKILEH